MNILRHCLKSSPCSEGIKDANLLFTHYFFFCLLSSSSPFSLFSDVFFKTSSDTQAEYSIIANTLGWTFADFLLYE